jgi:hypothetical protein
MIKEINLLLGFFHNLVVDSANLLILILFQTLLKNINLKLRRYFYVNSVNIYYFFQYGLQWKHIIILEFSQNDVDAVGDLEAMVHLAETKYYTFFKVYFQTFAAVNVDR